MKQIIVTIDINKLDVEDLEILENLFFNYGDWDDCKKIQLRIAFLNGWMSDKMEEKYLKDICVL